jgi:hypothetical protein
LFGGVIHLMAFLQRGCGHRGGKPHTDQGYGCVWDNDPEGEYSKLTVHLHLNTNAPSLTLLERK